MTNKCRGTLSSSSGFSSSKSADHISSRRRFLRNVFGGALAAIVGKISLRLPPPRTSSVPLPLLSRRRANLSRILALRPRWASWTVKELNFQADGWSQPTSWIPVILNLHRERVYYESFPNESRQPHHWVMVVDLRRCIGCQACVVACKSENNVPPGIYRTWVQVVEMGSMYPDRSGSITTGISNLAPRVRRWALPRLCNHCDNPPCVIVCPVKATFKRADGPVLVDYTKCIGCGICIQACPYDARYFSTVQETADKCTFCVHRLDRGLLPACVTSCVGRARVFGDLNNPNSAVSRLLAQFPTNRLLVEEGTKPQVFYIDLNGDLQTGATVFDTIYPYAVGTNTEEYDNLTGKVLLQKPLGGERSV